MAHDVEDEQQDRDASAVARARRGAWAAFCVTGLVAASWAGRVPAVAERLDLSAGGLAVAVLGIEGGALVGLPLGGALVTRWGSRLGLRAGFVAYGPGLLAAALAPSLAWLVLGLAVWAATNSVVDVALNAQGVELERRTRRPLLSGLHAAQGLGLLLGALLATAASALDLELVIHLGVVAALALAVGLAATLPLLREPHAPRPRSRVRRKGQRPRGPLLLLGAVAFCAFLIDGAATNWIAVQLRTEHDAAPGLAAAGYLVFTAALVLTRLAGNRLSARCTPAGIVRGCGLLTAAGVTVVILAPGAWIALAGWALVGVAVALLAPTVLSAAPYATPASEHDDSGPVAAAVPTPVAITLVTLIGYLGSFTGPPLIGALAEYVGLSNALTLIAVAGLAAALLAHCTPASSATESPARNSP
jgi:MFS family permease